MTDKKTLAILQTLHQLAGSTYTVLEKRKILESIPKRANVSADTLKLALMFLKEQGYVEIKYQDKQEICLCCTVKTESLLEGQTEATAKTTMSAKQFAVLCGATFLCAFLGSFLAHVVANLL